MSLQTDSEVFFVNEGFALPFLLKELLAKSTSSKAIILLHGVGNNENDLFSLSNELPDNLLIMSPRGLFTIGDGSYAWYQVDFSTGTPVINEAQKNIAGKICRIGERMKIYVKKNQGRILANRNHKS